jgi:hypothetical protein
MFKIKQMHNVKLQAGTNDHNGTDVGVTSSSQTIAKPNVICRFLSYGGELIDFVGEPIYYKVNGIYGYLCLCGSKVVHFYSDADGQIYFDEPNGWSVLNGI